MDIPPMACILLMDFTDDDIDRFQNLTSLCLWYNPIIQKLDWKRIIRGWRELRQLSRQLYTNHSSENHNDQFLIKVSPKYLFHGSDRIVANYTAQNQNDQSSHLPNQSHNFGLIVAQRFPYWGIYGTALLACDRKIFNWTLYLIWGSITLSWGQ